MTGLGQRVWLHLFWLFGGYLEIVREMSVDRYKFFLDKTIARRNEILVGELECKGNSPYDIPRSEL